MRMKGKKVYFSYRDTFSLDAALAPVILSALRKFKEVITSAPQCEWRGVPGRIVSDMFPDAGHEFSDEQLAAADVRWLEIIDGMIYAFDKNKEPNLKDYNFKFHHEVLERYESGSSRISITNDNQAEYDRYRADEKLHELKVQEGLSLFSEYFHSLWW